MEPRKHRKRIPVPHSPSGACFHEHWKDVGSEQGGPAPGSACSLQTQVAVRRHRCRVSEEEMGLDWASGSPRPWASTQHP